MNKATIYSAISLSLGLVFSDASAAAVRDIVNLKTTEEGLHEISYGQLLAYGADVDGEKVADIALMNRGDALQIHVTGSTADATIFGAGSVIRFIAQQVDTLYTDVNVYTLRSDVTNAQRMTMDNNPVPKGASANSYLASKTFSPQAKYSFTSPDGNDPWYAKRIVAVNKPVSENITMMLDDVAVGGNSGSTKAKLNVNLWGSTDIPGNTDDHSFKVSFNNKEVASATFDGLSAKTLSTSLETIRDGSNVVKVTLPMDTGYAFDAVNLNSIEIKYPRKFIAIDNRLNYLSTFKKFRIAGFDQNAMPNGASDLVVTRSDYQGVAMIGGSKVSCRRGQCRALIPGSGIAAQYNVSAKGALHQPELDALPIRQEINTGQAKYLIISHPDFMGSAGGNVLDALALERKSAVGSSDVVDVEAIYAQYGDHLFDPTAIQRYIKYAQQNRGTESVLLVGGDVYDYRQFENEDATSFIPSLYAATGNNISFAPVDSKYADVDDDNVPDLSIARLPVRTTAQLRALMNKRNAYMNRNYSGSALLVADDYDDVQQYDFSSDADEVAQDFLSNFSVSKAYVDVLGITPARNKIIQKINAGTTLTAFFGHSSTNQWSFNGVFTGPDAANLTNQNRPTVVMQWGCWNTYHVSPNEDSMGHRFMMEGEQGAVSVMGASTLTNADSERQLARLVFARLANGESLGDAVTNAKQEYATTNPSDLDVLLGWTILGFPELLIN